MPSDPSQNHSKHGLFESDVRKTQQSSVQRKDSLIKVIKKVSLLTRKFSIFTVYQMSTAGFIYTGDGDTARCEYCGLEVSNWTIEMTPCSIHSKQRPDCPFIRYVKSPLPSNVRSLSSSKAFVVPNATISNADRIQQLRQRTFSHWPHGETLPKAQMIDAGFFYCNISDRVICIYCNLICQEWTPRTDDPCKVHGTLSPNCIYIREKLMSHGALFTMADHESSTAVTTDNQSRTIYSSGRYSHVFVSPATHTKYNQISERLASFSTWPLENLPSVDDLATAGFVFTGKNTTVTCFYCNGSLQNWELNDNPTIEHARWFPHCQYVKQLCSSEMYQKIQEAQRASQDHITVNELTETGSSKIKFNIFLTTSTRPLLIPEKETLSAFTTARLDLPGSRRLVERNFNLNIIERCFDDQLKLKQDDFVSDTDLYVACLILKKQIEHINGNKENIVIPRIKMEQILEQNAAVGHQKKLTNPNPTHSILDSAGVDRSTSRQSPTNRTTSTTGNDQINDLIQYDPIHVFFSIPNRNN